MNRKLIKKLKNAENVAIFGHVNPDWDAVWSSLSIAWILQNMWKKAQVFLRSKPTSFTFLPNYDSIKTQFDYQDYDLIIIVDSSDINRLDAFYSENPSYFSSKEIVVIDHHIPCTNWFWVETSLIIQHPEYSSTCWLIFDLLYSDFQEYFDKNVATNMFFWIYTDTGQFVHEQDSEKVFFTSLTLIKLWADKPLIIDKFVKSKSIWEIKLLWELISRMKTQEWILYTYYDKDELPKFNIDKEISKVWYSTLSAIDWPKALVIAKKDSNNIRFWLRCKWKYDVQKVADHFGGWGHKHAAWFSLEISQWEDYIQKIKDTIKEIRRII